MLCGAAPLPASSGRTDRHRLNRGGDRQANTALYRIVLCRLRWDPRTRAYAARRTTQGLSRPEIIRCLKRYLAREVYTALLTPDLPHPDGEVPGSDLPGSDVLTADPSSAPAAPCTAQKASTRSARSAARTNGVDTAKRRKTINSGGNTPRRQPPNISQRDA
jgi:hypothetical protein